MTLSYPKVKKDPSFVEKFGHKIPDPYRWLEDEHSPDTQDFIDQQTALTQDYMAHVPQRDQIQDRLRQLTDYEKYGSVTVFDDYIIYSYNPGSKNQHLWYIQKGLEGEPELLLDPNKLSEDGTVAASILSLSKDQRYLSYLVSESGSDWQTIRVLDLASKENLPDTIRHVKFTWVAWDKEGFYYSGYPQSEQSGSLTAVNECQSIYYHKLGEDQEDDQLIYSDPDHPQRYCTLVLSEDLSEKLITRSTGTYGNEVLRYQEDKQDFDLIFQGFDSDRFFIGKYQDQLLFLTDEGASNKRIVGYQLDTGKVQDIVSEQEVPLQNAELVGNYLALEYMVDVASQLRLFNLKDGDEKILEIPDHGTLYTITGSEALDGIIYSFTTMKEPLAFYYYSFSQGTSQVFRQSQLPLDTSDLVVERHFVEASDGAKVPLFMLYKQGIQKDSNNPTLLYAYGGFNITTPLSFSPMNVFLADHGGIYVQANIRGGSEYGEAWHRQGMMENKQRVFDDFIECAEFLVESGYTSKDKLAITGGSNGGLLIGAVTNQRPDLFRVALPKVGVMDMLRYHLFTVGWGWIPEFGDPEDEVHFNNILKYSPLHNIQTKDYPSVMIFTADHDDRVVPAHSLKYGASLQAHNTSDNPILLRIDQKAGHGAGKSLAKVIDEYADMYAFMAWEMGHSLI